MKYQCDTGLCETCFKYEHQLTQAEAMVKELEWYETWFKALSGHVTIDKARENWKALEQQLAQLQEENTRLKNLMVRTS